MSSLFLFLLLSSSILIIAIVSFFNNNYSTSVIIMPTVIHICDRYCSTFLHDDHCVRDDDYHGDNLILYPYFLNLLRLSSEFDIKLQFFIFVSEISLLLLLFLGLANLYWLKHHLATLFLELQFSLLDKRFVEPIWQSIFLITSCPSRLFTSTFSQGF